MKRRKSGFSIWLITMLVVGVICISFIFGTIAPIGFIFQAPKKEPNSMGGVTYTNNTEMQNKMPGSFYGIRLPKQFPKELIPVVGDGKVTGYKVELDKDGSVYTAELAMYSRKSSTECAAACETFYAACVVLQKEMYRIEEMPGEVNYSYKLQDETYRYNIEIEVDGNSAQTYIVIEAVRYKSGTYLY